MSKQTEALRLALEGLEKWHFDKDPRGAAAYITAIHEALAEESSGTEQPPCKTGSQCTSKCEQCRYKYDCDKAEQPAQKIVEEYDPDSRTISVYPSEWKAQQDPTTVAQENRNEHRSVQ